MTEECITPLRRRMIEDMSVRHFASKTQHDYIRSVMKLTRFLGRSPDTATNEDLRRFQLHLTENRAGAPIINSTVSALRFFFTVTLDRADAARHLTFVHEPRKLPVVLSPEEVARLLEAAPGVKYKAALSVAYGATVRRRRSQPWHLEQTYTRFVRRGCGVRDGSDSPGPYGLEGSCPWPGSWAWPHGAHLLCRFPGPVSHGHRGPVCRRNWQSRLRLVCPN
jgi:integrase